MTLEGDREPPEARNLILVGTNGLGKSMIAQNICHAAVPPECYLDYLRLKLRQAATAPPANAPKSTFSDDR